MAINWFELESRQFQNPTIIVQHGEIHPEIISQHGEIHIAQHGEIHQGVLLSV